MDPKLVAVVMVTRVMVEPAQLLVVRHLVVQTRFARTAAVGVSLASVTVVLKVTATTVLTLMSV